MDKKIPISVVLGPTASGKTDFAVRLAQKLGGEVVSFDSMQIYKELSIVTAKPTAEEMQGVPHHMIDFLSVSQPFSVADYCEMARVKIFDIFSRGKSVVLVGGTGLYIDSLVSNIDFFADNKNEEIRAELQELYAEKGGEFLHAKLAECDPFAAEEIHPNNVKRVIRALEIYRTTGLNKTQNSERARRESPFLPTYFGLNFNNRERLYERINQRVDKMVEQGLIDEVRAFWGLKSAEQSRAAIGLKELKPFIDRVQPLETCLDKMKRESRRYAKRQLTWFRRNGEIDWVYLD